MNLVPLDRQLRVGSTNSPNEEAAVQRIARLRSRLPAQCRARSRPSPVVGIAGTIVLSVEVIIREFVMSDHVYKVVEIVGSSKVGVDDAIRNAIETSAKTIRHISWFEVVKTTGHVVADKVAHFQVTLKIGFRIETD
jgi:flavin-binding protein dodecin